MNTMDHIDDHIEDSDDEDNCNSDFVEDGGILVVLRFVYIQTSQHQKDDARQNLEKGLIIFSSVPNYHESDPKIFKHMETSFEQKGDF